MKLARSRILARVIILLILSATAVPLSSATPPTPQPTPRRSTRTVQYGTASWYGRHWRGRITASGAYFDDRALTAAHRTLPLGSIVRVTNLRNGLSVVVRITDRGPWIHRRLIDLSRAAAQQIGFTHRGIAPVKLQVVKDQGTDQAAWDRGCVDNWGFGVIAKSP